MRLNEINTYTIEQWMLELDKAGYHKTTINNYYYTLRIMLNEAVRRGLLRKSPAEGIKKLAAEDKVRKLLTQDELKALFPPDWQKVWKNRMAASANLLAAYTGMRMGEVVGLKGDLVFPTYITVKGQYNVDNEYTQTKNKKERDIPITSGIHQELEGLLRLNGSGYVFSLDGGKTPINRDLVYNSLCDALEVIGISEKERKERGLNFHAWRHFFVTYLRMNNVSDKKARDVAGHSSAFMSDHYTHMDTKAFDDVRSVQAGLAIALPEN
jgi:integrase